MVLGLAIRYGAGEKRMRPAEPGLSMLPPLLNAVMNIIIIGALAAAVLHNRVPARKPTTIRRRPCTRA